MRLEEIRTATLKSLSEHLEEAKVLSLMLRNDYKSLDRFGAETLVFESIFGKIAECQLFIKGIKNEK